MSHPPNPPDADALRRLNEAIARLPAVHDYSPALWPAVFVTGKVEADSPPLAGQGSAQARWQASSLALVAWGHCARGCTPPKNLAPGLLALAHLAGLSAEDLLAENAKAVEAAALAEVVAGKRAGGCSLYMGSSSEYSGLTSEGTDSAWVVAGGACRQ